MTPRPPTVWASTGRRARWHALLAPDTRRTACGRTMPAIHAQRSGLTEPGHWLRCGTCHELELVRVEAVSGVR